MLEFTDNSSEGPIIYIEIVRIELHRVSAALWGMDRLIPAAPNSEIVSLRNDHGVRSACVLMSCTRPCTTCSPRHVP